jgi:hypothetical protein
MMMLTDHDADREGQLGWANLVLLTATFTVILVVGLICLVDAYICALGYG